MTLHLSFRRILFLLLMMGKLVKAAPMRTLEVVMDMDVYGVDHRLLQEQVFNGTAKCYSTQDENNMNRFCSFEDTPREGTFLIVSCPHSRGEDLSECECTIGIGLPENAPNTPTCTRCAFCRDGTLSYNCENVARGTCIGRSCGDECIASSEYSETGPLLTTSTVTIGVVLWLFLPHYLY